MKPIQNLITLIVLFLFFIPEGTKAYESSVMIDLTKKTQKLVGVVVTPFRPVPDQPRSKTLGKKIRKVLEKDLKLTEMFRVLPETNYRELDLEESDPSKIRYDLWESAGTQWVVKTQYWSDRDKNTGQFIFRLFDAFNKKFVVGKRYSGPSSLARNMAHRFADEMVAQLTGKRGVSETQIAYVKEVTNGNREIHLIDFDGHGSRQISHERSITLKPTWSPDGSRIVFTSFAKNNPDMVMLDIVKNQRWSVLTLPGLNAAPSWSPDGSKIALALSRDRNSEIYYLTKKRELRRLTKNFNIDTSPTWSPDGKQIAFTSDRSGRGSPQIYIMDVNKGDYGPLKRISFDSSYNDNPVWSPDGDKIAYTSLMGKIFQIKIYDVKSQKTITLTNGNNNSEEPSWSPDGRFLIFGKKENGIHYLYTKKIDSNKERRLTRGLHSSWSPYMD